MSSAASRSIITHGKQEAAFEDVDRSWRRWTGFLARAGYRADPFLLALPPTDTELVARAFLSCVRNFKWCADGTLGLPHEAAVLSGTVRETTSHVAASFRNHFKCSPFHNPVGSHFLPSISNLLKSYTDVDPATKRQKAISPKLLRHMYSLAKGGGDNINFITAQLAIGGFFFAMRSCEQVQTPVPGKTKIIDLDGCTFRCKNKREIPHSSKHLHTAEYITITWKDQKNGIRMDSRTQRRTGDPILCPVTAFAYLIHRIRLTVPDYNPSTPICAVYVDGCPRSITQEFLRNQLRMACQLGGGKEAFGFEPHEIGTKSIRSGAAMSLFLMDHHPHKIMILGRWSSEAFLVYIRPQVLEWTNNMSHDMIRFDSFTDITRTSDTAGNASWLAPQAFNGSGSILVPKLHLLH